MEFSIKIKSSFTIEGQKFKYISSSYKEIVFEDKEKNKVILSTQKYFNKNPGLYIADEYEIKYKDKTIICDNTNYCGKGTVITMANGSKHVQEYFSIFALLSNIIGGIIFNIIGLIIPLTGFFG